MEEECRKIAEKIILLQFGMMIMKIEEFKDVLCNS